MTDYAGLQINTFFIFFFTFLGVLIVFGYAEFRNAKRFPLAHKVFHKSYSIIVNETTVILL